MLQFLLVSILCAMGLAILLVEKGHVYPMRFWNVKLRRLIRNLSGKYGKKWRGKRPEEVLYCVVCTSFWATLITDSVLWFITHSYFLWPLSGFACAGIVYLVFQLINALDKD